jgi:hypothetical protein
MEAINVKRTGQIPKITLDKESNTFEFSGPSLPEDAIEFYEPILSWIDTYLENPNEKSDVVFKIDYYNTASSKMIFEILKKFGNLYLSGKDVEIHWYYPEDDEDMQEAGEDFSSVVTAPFKLISVGV